VLNLIVSVFLPLTTLIQTIEYMKIPLLIFILFLIGCSSYKTSQYSYLNHQKYKLVTVPFEFKKDTLSVTEIRFYKIRSAKNTQQILYDKFGKWNQRTLSKYGNRMNQLVWINKSLLKDNNQFTIFADGVETNTDYYASVIVLDANFKDCINPSHPLSELLIKKLTKMMEDRLSVTNFYTILKE